METYRAAKMQASALVQLGTMKVFEVVSHRRFQATAAAAAGGSIGVGIVGALGYCAFSSLTDDCVAPSAEATSIDKCKADDQCPIIGLSKAGHPVTAHAELLRSIELGLTPTPRSINAVILSYAKAGAFTRARGLAREMQSLGVELEHSTYETLAQVFARAGDGGKAERLLRDVIDKGLVVSAKNFDGVLRALAKKNWLWEVEKCRHMAEERGVQLGQSTFVSMVSIFVRKGDVNNAMKWITLMAEHGMSPPTCWLIQILALLKEKDEQAIDDVILQRMRVAESLVCSDLFSRCLLLASSPEEQLLARCLEPSDF